MSMFPWNLSSLVGVGGLEWEKWGPNYSMWGGVGWYRLSLLGYLRVKRDLLPYCPGHCLLLLRSLVTF